MTGLRSHQHDMQGALSSVLASMGWHDPAATLATCSKFLSEVASSIAHYNNMVSVCTDMFSHPAATKQYAIIPHTVTFGETMLVEL